MGFVALIAVASFVLGGGTEAFAPRFKLLAQYDDVQGLKPGAIVRLAGIDIGEVTKVDLADKSGDPAAQTKNVSVLMSIRMEYQPKILTDSVAGITGVGVLGDNIVTITVGTAGKEMLKDGDTITTSEPLSFLNYADNASAIIDNTASISHKFDLMLGGEDAAAAGAIGNSLAHVEAMLKEAKEGKGVLHILFYDEAAGRKTKAILANVESVTADVAGMTHEIRTGDGLAHELIYGDGGEALADELSDFAGEMTGLVQDIKTKDSLMHSVLYDPAKARMMDDLAVTTGEVKEILQAVSDGEGTAGLLVRDPQLYEDLRALLGGAQRNALLRAYVRSTMAHAREEDGGVWRAPTSTPETGGK